MLAFVFTMIYLYIMIKTKTDMTATKAKTLNKIDSLKVNLIVLGYNGAADIVQDLQNTNSELLKALKLMFDNPNDPEILMMAEQAIKKADSQS